MSVAGNARLRHFMLAYVVMYIKCRTDFVTLRVTIRRSQERKYLGEGGRATETSFSPLIKFRGEKVKRGNLYVEQDQIGPAIRVHPFFSRGAG